jgi:Zn-dependent peptidase ImmA (M78 family)
VTLRRGFLVEAERHAARIRDELSLGPADPVDVGTIAQHLGVRVVAADELIDRARLEELERLQAWSFSACTLDIHGRKVIVFNPLRSPPRTQSDLAHELAHLLLGHDLDEVRVVAGTPFRTCLPDQEEEATSLGGTLLLPRPLLLKAARKGLGVKEIAEQYGVTPEMARFRLNKTGVARQASDRGRIRTRAGTGRSG